LASECIGTDFEMTIDLADTITAIASAPGGAIRGIVRISGPAAVSIVSPLFTTANGDPLASTGPPTCHRGNFSLPRDLGPVPATLYLWPTTSSYTRQPSAELHLPGSPPILEAALEAVCQAGARLARPGEFTLRAFLAGRLDLTQAEAVLGVIDAGTRQELDAALSQLAGGLAKPLAALRGQLLDLLAELEAGLDFVEEDIEFISRDALQKQLASIAVAVNGLINQLHSRREAGVLPRVVLAGLPNAGKSSLLNALAGENAAIVSEIAGTTRDFVTYRAKFGDSECLITDTAGLMEDSTTTGVDAAAQSATRDQTRQADLVLLCLDAAQPPAIYEQKALADSLSREKLIIWTKCDLAPNFHPSDNPAAIHTSSRTGQGLAELRAKIASALAARPTDASAVLGTAERCGDSLRRALESIERARTAEAEELIASELRLALDELGLVAGVTYTDDILDRIFSRFCIGK
jgi:tRNA modification GTPase